MPAVDITEASYSGGFLQFTVLFENDTDMDAEGSASIGGPGINFSFQNISIPSVAMVGIPAERDKGGDKRWH